MTVDAKPTIDLDRAREVVDRFQSESTKWLYGLDDAARILSWAFFTLLPYTDKLSQGKLLRQPHIMFRGPTGTGKTDLVSACAMAVDAKFERIQGLPTYMPEDILGYETIVEELDGTRKIHFKPGKLMAHIVLIDEDNRLSGKTKAAVLEGMEESSATLSSSVRKREPLPTRWRSWTGPRCPSTCWTPKKRKTSSRSARTTWSGSMSRS